MTKFTGSLICLRSFRSAHTVERERSCTQHCLQCQLSARAFIRDVFVQYPEIIEVGCMAHARRYFKEALPTAAVPCAQALALIKQLYGIERVASDKRLDAPARQRARQEQARPILE